MMRMLEVKSAFKMERNNGHGLTMQLHDNYEDGSLQHKQKNTNQTILIKWFNALNTRSNGTQVWSKLDKVRDF